MPERKYKVQNFDEIFLIWYYLLIQLTLSAPQTIQEFIKVLVEEKKWFCIPFYTKQD